MYLSSYIPVCQASLGQNEELAILDALRSGYLSSGPCNELFEYEFAKFLNVKEAIGVNSSTTAMQMILLANKIKGEVIVPSFIFPGMVNAIVTSGAKPVFIDINIEDQLLNASLLEGLLTKKTEAVIVSHYAGQCADMDAIVKFCNNHKLLLIEDVGLGVGAKFNNKFAGTFGVGCFAALPSKGMPIGEGGMITTNDPEIASKIKNLISNGLIKGLYSWNKESIVAGYEVRMSNLLASVGCSQITHYDTLIDYRKWAATLYDEYLDSVVVVPKSHENRRHVYSMYTILVPSHRDEIVSDLHRMNIGASVCFDPPCHKQYAHRSKSVLPYTQWISTHIISLPMYSYMKKSDICRVGEAVRDRCNIYLSI